MERIICLKYTAWVLQRGIGSLPRSVLGWNLLYEISIQLYIASFLSGSWVTLILKRLKSENFRSEIRRLRLYFLRRNPLASALWGRWRRRPVTFLVGGLRNTWPLYERLHVVGFTPEHLWQWGAGAWAYWILVIIDCLEWPRIASGHNLYCLLWSGTSHTFPWSLPRALWAKCSW